MATTTGFPPSEDTALALKAILKDLGIAPIILDNWTITIDEDPITWTYYATMIWRTYRIRKAFNKDEISNLNIDVLSFIGRLIASELWKFNEAEDEEHMEALVLLSMRPTNEPTSQSNHK